MSTNGGRAWTAIFRLIQSQKPWMAEKLAEFDLTLMMAHALDTLAGLGEASMSEFAGAMFCDASNATGLIDRLERRGLAARHAAEHDRRAKVVRLTPEGARLNKRLERIIWGEPPPPIADLSAADQRTLREILERAVAGTDLARFA
jgi:DNA-binding MarR family transcriptional regulator